MKRRGRALAASAGSPPTEPPPAGSVRCAIYTRKSIERGLEQEFNSLDLQREACEAFITSQKHAGWVALPRSYDDGGYSGGNMDRPALAHLMADIEAGKVDAVVTYKVDRMSRSLGDFAKMMEVFERKKVSFVSVTQHFNTATSLGRLILHILLSFAQFERETIIERVRDKMSAARRKGKWIGGNPVLGYDVAPEGRRLVVNGEEAERVRAIFRTFLEKRSLFQTVRELERLGWKTKQWTSRRSQRPIGGRPFCKQSLWELITNAAYVGKIEYDGGIYEAEHPAIVERSVFDQAQEILKRNGRGSRTEGRIKHETLLRDLLRCRACGSPMVHNFTVKKGRRFRYYVCSRLLREGWDKCSTRSLPMEEMDRFIVEQIRAVSRDCTLAAEVVRQARGQQEKRGAELEGESAAITKELRSASAAIGELAARIGRSDDSDPASTNHLTELEERMREMQRRRGEIREELRQVKRSGVSPSEVMAAFEAFDPGWDALTPAERSNALHLLLESVVYDSERNVVSLAYRPLGIKALAESRAIATEVA